MLEITKSEKWQRRLAVDNAIGTHVMEGLPPDSETHRILELYAAGEFTEEQFEVAMDRHAQSVLNNIRARSYAGAA